MAGPNLHFSFKLLFGASVVCGFIGLGWAAQPFLNAKLHGARQVAAPKAHNAAGAGLTGDSVAGQSGAKVSPSQSVMTESLSRLFLVNALGTIKRRVVSLIEPTPTLASKTHELSRLSPEIALKDLSEVQDPLQAEANQPSPPNIFQILSKILERAGYFSKAPLRNDPAPAVIELKGAVLNENYCEPILELLREEIPLRVINGIIPKGLILNRADGSLCGTSQETGIFRFDVLRQDSEDSTFLYSFRLVVRDESQESSGEKLQIATSQLDVARVGANYVYQLLASGGELPLSWTVAGLPDGLELDAESGLLGGSPVFDGEFPLSLQVRDAAGGADGKILVLTIRTTPIFITTQELDDGVLGEAFQLRFSAQGGIPPYRWENVSADLPSGLEFNDATGTIDGVPEEVFDAPLRVRVFDSVGKSDTAEYTLRVRNSSLAILSRGVVEGFKNKTYAFSFVAEQGVVPYRWGVSSGLLPQGINLSSTGELSGNPLEAGEFAFEVFVSDRLNATVSRRFRLRIQDIIVSEPPPSLPADGESGGGTNTGGGVGGTPDNGNDESDFVLGVTNFTAISSDKKVGLVWKNPVSQNFVKVFVVRNSANPPVSLEDGVIVYEGAVNNFVDEGLENAKEYFYAVFADFGDFGVSEGSNIQQAVAQPNRVSLTGKPSPFVDSVADFKPLDPSCFNCRLVPDIVLGPPKGSGESSGSQHDVVSIGARVNNDGGKSSPYGGSITLEFRDNIVVDKAGVDFTIFENAFRISDSDDYFVEPAVVEVSVDGEEFYRFVFNFAQRFDNEGKLNLFNPFVYAKGFAGVHPVYSNANSPPATNATLSGGDQFDLADLPGRPLSWIRYVRITSTGDAWLTDEDGDLVRHSNSHPFYAAKGSDNSGFDLDSVVAVNY